MDRPYRPLDPSVVEVARALVRAPGWRWPMGVVGIYPDGRLVEVRGAEAWGPELIPLLTDEATAGRLLELLGAACGEGITWEVGQRRAGRTVRYWARLTAGVHAREWGGATVGEAVGRALLARWERAGAGPR